MNWRVRVKMTLPPNFKRFKLSEQFIDQYRGKQPEWGPIGYVVYKRTYARLKEDGSTEEFWETLRRVVEGVFNIQKEHVISNKLFWDTAKAQKTAQDMYNRMWEFKLLPPGRGLWVCGSSFVKERSAGALFNCGMISTEDIAFRGGEIFEFIMSALMLGIGVGFDTLGAGKIKLKTPRENNGLVYIIPDTREGWAESVKLVINGFLNGDPIPSFDYSQIRKAGEPIKGFGGIASGPEPLRRLHKDLQLLLENREGEYITSGDIVDIENLISKAVIAGNIRRSAALALGNPYDSEFISLKQDKDKLYSHRFASNNSVSATVGMDYSNLISLITDNGEPGIQWLENARKWGRTGESANDSLVSGTNPCFTGDMLLYTENGPMPFANLCGKEGLLIKDEKGILRNGKVWKTGKKQTIKLCLSNGNYIKCTPDHKILTSAGNFVLACDSINERLAVLIKPRSLIEIKSPKVMSIINNGEDYVYDFSIDSFSHLGVVNGIVVHNCGEIFLEGSGELCNLCETFPAHHDTKEDFIRTLELAYLYCKTITLTTTEWPRTNAAMLKNRRLGISVSGIIQAFTKHGRRNLLSWFDEGYKHIRKFDEQYSNWLAIPKSIKVTTVKPSGTTSTLCGATPGIHYPEAEYYIRRVRFDKKDPLLKTIQEAGYTIEDDAYNKEGVVVEFPVHELNFQKSKYDVSLWEQMENAAQLQKYWSDNAVSITVTFKKHEEQDLISVLELYEDKLKSVSFLPLSTHGYKQAPYEAISKEKYEEMTSKLKLLDLSKNITEAIGEKYCDGDSCVL